MTKHMKPKLFDCNEERNKLCCLHHSVSTVHSLLNTFVHKEQCYTLKPFSISSSEDLCLGWVFYNESKIEGLKCEAGKSPNKKTWPCYKCFTLKQNDAYILPYG